MKQAEIRELLASIPSELRDTVNAYVHADMEKSSEPMIQDLENQRQAGLPTVAPIDVGMVEYKEDAMMPFRVSRDRMIRRHRTTPLRTPRGLNGMSSMGLSPSNSSTMLFLSKCVRNAPWLPETSVMSIMRSGPTGMTGITNVWSNFDQCSKNIEKHSISKIKMPPPPPS